MRDTGGGSGGQTGGDGRMVAASGRLAEPTLEIDQTGSPTRANLPQAIVLCGLAPRQKCRLEEISRWPIVTTWTSPALVSLETSGAGN